MNVTIVLSAVVAIFWLATAAWCFIPFSGLAASSLSRQV